MALYTKSQLAELLGKTPAWVSMYVKRKKMVMRGDYIDDTIRENEEFIAKWLSKKVDEPPKKSTKPVVPPPNPNSLPPPELPENFDWDSEDDIETASMGALDRAGKIEEIRRKQSVTKLNELKARKIRGETIPTNLVMNVFAMLGHQFQVEYKNAGIQMIIEIGHRAKLPPEIIAEMRHELTLMINSAHKSAIKSAKEQIKSIVADAADIMNDETVE